LINPKIAEQISNESSPSQINNNVKNVGDDNDGDDDDEDDTEYW